MNRRTATIAARLIVIFVAPIATTYADSNRVPPQASGVGYTSNTFHSTFQSDVQASGNQPKQINWYLEKWFTLVPTPQESISISPPDGITLTNGGDSSNYTIGSAAARKSNSPHHWVGKAFGGGGYFEADIRFDLTRVTQPGGVGFPSWWLMPVEHFAEPRTDQWVGQANGYEHFTELDIFEYNQWASHPNAYSGAVHEWYGVYGKTCLPNFCHASNTNNEGAFNNFIIQTPGTTDFSQFHRYGLLWVTATDTTQGYLQYYFDGAATNDRITWERFTNQAPPPGRASWAFSVTDRLHFVLILGTGNGQPMTIRSVNVWQSSASQNISN